MSCRCSVKNDMFWREWSFKMQKNWDVFDCTHTITGGERLTDSSEQLPGWKVTQRASQRPKSLTSLTRSLWYHRIGKIIPWSWWRMLSLNFVAPNYTYDWDCTVKQIAGEIYWDYVDTPWDNSSLYIILQQKDFPAVHPHMKRFRTVWLLTQQRRKQYGNIIKKPLLQIL